MAAATEFISLIESPDVTNVQQVLPFLIRRCGRNIDKRINDLHTTLKDPMLLEDFREALETYTPPSEFRLEFPSKTLQTLYQDSTPSFNIVWQNFLDTLTELTSAGLQPLHDPSASHEHRIIEIFTYADTIASTSFFKSLINDDNIKRKNRAEKFKRRVDKIGQYVSGISVLLQKAKRLAPISYRWVMDDFSGSGEGTFTLCDDPHDAVSRAMRKPLLPFMVAKLDENFPSLRDNWARQQEVHACLHAELRIILHLGPPPSSSTPLRDIYVTPIGVGRRSCFCCMVWIKCHNKIFDTKWMVSGSHGKMRVNWALPGPACPYDKDESMFRMFVLAFNGRMLNTLERFLGPQLSEIEELEARFCEQIVWKEIAQYRAVIQPQN
ncbi:hypothetical protein H0H93_012823 [Arthromyces matolae]|nr:hypothetical protein H0H93_012823 [Arthromyces matolae]